MEIVYQCSEEFFNTLSISVFSLLKNTSKSENINIHIFSKNMSETSKNKLLSFRSFSPLLNIEIIPLPDLHDKYGVVFDDYNGKWGINSFIRIFLASNLPTLQKVIFLDSDTLICNDLSDLWNTNIDGFYAAAVIDPVSKKYLKFLGLSENDFYCNSGVLLWNLDLLRRDKVESKFVDYTIKKKGFIFFSEQTVLNVVCKGKIKLLDPKFNVTTLAVTLSSKQLAKLRNSSIENFYSKESISQAIKYPTILHMTTSFVVVNRAWYEKSNYSRKDVFESYANQIPFFEYSKDKRSAKRKVVDFLVRICPKSILCPAVGAFYNNGRLKAYKRYCSRKDK